jgi:hypothetical protein
VGAAENAREWLANEASPEQRAAIERRLNPDGGLLASVNAVAITGPQMRAAIEAIQHIPLKTQGGASEHARMLREFAREYGFASDYAGPALHMRAVAMDRWCRLHDPESKTDRDAFFEAAGRFPLTQTDKGMAFEPEGFAELIQFITDMPF